MLDLVENLDDLDRPDASYILGVFFLVIFKTRKNDDQNTHIYINQDNSIVSLTTNYAACMHMHIDAVINQRVCLIIII